MPLAVKLAWRLRRERERDIRDVQQGGKIDPKDEKRFNELATKLCKLHIERFALPDSEFWNFVKAKRKDGNKEALRILREIWEGKKDVVRLHEEEWNQSRKLYADLHEFEQKRLKVLNELRTIIMKPKVFSDLKFKRGFDYFWEDVKDKVERDKPITSEYAREKVTREMWSELPMERKKYYLTKSWMEKEELRHKMEMEKLREHLEALKKLVREREKLNLL